MSSLFTWGKKLFARGQSKTARKKQRRACRLTIEPLEDRLLLFTFLGGTWSQPGGLGTPVNVTYSYQANLFDGGIVGISSFTIVRAIEEALSLWARYTPFTFTEVASGQITFRHGDLTGSTLGQATGPPGGDITFDSSSRTWSTSLFLETATHEIGHALGLGHSTLSSARVDAAGPAGPPIMNPTILNRYSGLGSAFLFQDDVDGIRARYGSGTGEVITPRNWIAATDGDWDTDANWTRGFEPTINSNVTIENNRTVAITSAARSARTVTLGNLDGQTGTLNVTGGSLTARQNIRVGVNGEGTLTISAGTVTAVGLAFGGNASTDQQQVNVSGGTLRLTAAVTDGIGTSTLTVSSGTLDLNNNNLTVDRFLYNGGTLLNTSGATTVNNLLQVRNVTLAIPNITLQGGFTLDSAATGSATVNSNLNLNGGTRTFTLADTAAGSDVFVNGVISNGGVAVTGAGTLQLQAVNTYTGQTTVNAGELFVTGSIAGSATTVANGAALRGTGTVGAVVANGQVRPGSAAGTLTVNGNYTQNATGQLQIELGGATAGSGYDVLQVNGNAALAGQLDASLINGFQLTSGATFDVLRANTITLNGLTLVGSQAGNLSMSVVTVGSQQVLRLTVTNFTPFVQILDDGDAGFTATSGFSPFTGQGFNGDVTFAAAGTGGESATWTFTGLPSGLYRVSATWSVHPNRATNAPYTVLDGVTNLGTARVNQELAPNHFTANGATWFNLGGPYSITSGTLIVQLTNDANEYVIADAIRIERLSSNPVQVLDDGDAGFTATGGFTFFSGQGFQNDVRFAEAGTGSSVATWTFAVTPGTYRVSITWSEHPNRATNAPFTVLDGAAVLGTFPVNQETAPADFAYGGANWRDLGGGVFTIFSNTLVVRLTDLANEYVIADAVRIERLT